MAQQTAVEWLIDKLSNAKAEDVNATLEVRLICQKAKAMEKDQIAEAYRIGVEEDVYINPLRTGNEYYNETYNK